MGQMISEIKSWVFIFTTFAPSCVFPICVVWLKVSLPDGPTVKAPARWIPMKNHKSFEQLQSTLPGRSFDGHCPVLCGKNLSNQKEVNKNVFCFFESEEHVKIHTHRYRICDSAFFRCIYSIGMHRHSYF